VPAPSGYDAAAGCLAIGGTSVANPNGGLPEVGVDSSGGATATWSGTALLLP
jgi:hypothetical protein